MLIKMKNEAGCRALIPETTTTALGRWKKKGAKLESSKQDTALICRIWRRTQPTKNTTCRYEVRIVTIIKARKHSPKLTFAGAARPVDVIKNPTETKPANRIGPFKHFSRIVPPSSGGILTAFNGHVDFYFIFCFLFFFLPIGFSAILFNRLLQLKNWNLRFFCCCITSKRLFFLLKKGGSMQISFDCALYWDSVGMKLVAGNEGEKL